MNFKKIQLSRLLLEFISVSFAVLLALFLNQWREDYNNSKHANQVIQNIKEEFVENNEVISELVINHKLLLLKLDSISLLKEAHTSADNMIESIDISIINSSAWEMAKVTDAVLYINFDDISNLAKVYGFQTYYESIVKEYVLANYINSENIYSKNRLDNTKKFLQSIIPMEEDLQEYYQLILTQVLIDYNK